MKRLLLILACMSLLIACEKYELPDRSRGGMSLENMNDALIECGNVEPRLPNDFFETSNLREASEL